MRHHALSRCGTHLLTVMLGLAALFLTGCGTYYTVSVDSLCDTAQPDTGAYFLTPGDENVRQDDLLFREVARIVEQGLSMQGKTVVENRSEAQNIARITYWEGIPELKEEIGTRTTSVPVTTRYNGKYHTEYVSVEEPTVTTYTTYSAKMLVEAFSLNEQGQEGKPTWRTELTCSAGEDDFRHLLLNMGPVLPRALGTQTNRIRRFELFVEDDSGKTSVSEMD